MKTGKNRPIIITVMLLLASVASMSQSFPDPDNRWSVVTTNWDLYLTEIFAYTGDTVIHNQSYQKICSTYDSSYSSGWMYSGAIRGEADHIYAIFPYMENEGLLYDFSVEAGDTLNIINAWCLEPFPIVCESIDSVEINGSFRKKFTFENQYSQWIEGIGSLEGPLNTGMTNCIFDVYSSLLCFHVDNNLSYPPDANSCYLTNVGVTSKPLTDHFRIYPNPAKSYIVVEADQTPKEACYLEIFNPNGIKVLEKQIETTTTFLNLASLSNGIYFVRIADNGKLFTQKFIKRQ